MILAALLLSFVLGDDALRSWVARFNADDEEIYTNAVSNAEAADFLADAVPRFECPDRELERVYWFRWWTYRKHLKKTPGGWVVTEFLPDVPWAGKYNTISCPLGHHLREGRWLRDRAYLDDYTRVMMAEGNVNGRRAYVNWPAWATLERLKVSGDGGFSQKMLPDFVRNYEAWERGWEQRLWTERPPRPFQAGFKPARGLFDVSSSYEGSEFQLSAEGARPMVNAAMWAEATAIARIAACGGEEELARRFAGKAASLEQAVKSRLWNPEKGFFTTLNEQGERDSVCELHGYAPFYFGMPLDRGYDVAWRPLLSEKGFRAAKGLTFPTQDSPGFDVTIRFDRHMCLWNGPSWPYATSVALTALYRRLQEDASVQRPVGAADFVALLRQYAAQHVLTLPNGHVVSWIDENLHPSTGEWIARKVLAEQARRSGRPQKVRERGKDYNHSTFCDLVIAGLCGIVPRSDGQVDVKPLAPPEWDWWCIDGICYHGDELTVLYDRDGRRYGRGRGIVVVRSRPNAAKKKGGDVRL